MLIGHIMTKNTFQKKYYSYSGHIRSFSVLWGSQISSAARLRSSTDTTNYKTLHI